MADPPVVAAVSGHRQEVAFFGERDTTGNLLQSVRTYDFDLGRTITWPIVGKEKLHDPVAVAYRVQDDSYWLLDRVRTHHHRHRNTMRLVRAARGLSVQLVAQWEVHDADADLGLTAGADGSLVLSASRDGRHAIAVIDLDDSLPKLAALFFGRDPIALAAYKSMDGITFATRAKDGTIVAQKQVVRRHHDPDLDDDRDDENLSLEDLRRIF